MIKIKKSKTDQLGESETIYIHKTEKKYSLFKWLPLHLKNIANIQTGKMFTMAGETFRAFFKEKLQDMVHLDRLSK